MLLQDLHTPQPFVSGPWATSDSWLAFLGTPRPSATIYFKLANLTGAGPILFYGPQDDPSLIPLYYAISYLAWPRGVGLFSCGSARRPPQAIVPVGDSVRPSALIYYSQISTDLVNNPVVLGQKLTLVPIAENEAWTTLCP